MLEACDRLGMLVMDELTDMWNRHKNPYDYADIFQEQSEPQEHQSNPCSVWLMWQEFLD